MRNTNQHTSCPRSWAVNKLYYMVSPAWKSGKWSPDMESNLCSLRSPWLCSGGGSERSSLLTPHWDWHLWDQSCPTKDTLRIPSDTRFEWLSVVAHQCSHHRGMQPLHPSLQQLDFPFDLEMLDVGVCTCTQGRAISGGWSTSQRSPCPRYLCRSRAGEVSIRLVEVPKKSLHSLLGE